MQTVELERLRLPAGARLLDLGCGEGRHAIHVHLSVDAHVVALDRSLDDLLTGRRRQGELLDGAPAEGLDFAAGDALGLPFADDAFDAVICSEVLEHIPDYRGALDEIARVLKPGGVLAVSVPRFGPEWVCWGLSEAYHQVEGGHVRIFRARGLRGEIERLGLSCYARHWAHALHAPYWWLQCLFWSRREKVLAVRAYHRLLVWDMLRRPWLTRTLENALNPLIGKSVVMYFRSESSRPARAA